MRHRAEQSRAEQSIIMSEKWYWSILLPVLLGIICPGSGHAAVQPVLSCSTFPGNGTSTHTQYINFNVLNNNDSVDLFVLNDTGGRQEQIIKLNCALYLTSSPSPGEQYEFSNIKVKFRHAVMGIPFVYQGVEWYNQNLHDTFNFKPGPANPNSIQYDQMIDRVGYIVTVQSDPMHLFPGGANYASSNDGGVNFEWSIPSTLTHNKSEMTAFGMVFVLNRNIITHYSGNLFDPLITNDPSKYIPFNDETIEFIITADALTPSGTVHLSSNHEMTIKPMFYHHSNAEYGSTCTTPNIDQNIVMGDASVADFPSGGGSLSEGEVTFEIHVMNCKRILQSSDNPNRPFIRFFPLGGESSDPLNGILHTFNSSVMAKGVDIQILVFNPASNAFVPVCMNGGSCTDLIPHLSFVSQGNSIADKIKFKARYHSANSYLLGNTQAAISAGEVRGGFKIQFDYQ